MKEFDREIAERNLSGGMVVAWQERLAGEPLKDDDVDKLNDELQLNPQEVAKAIANEIRNGESRISILVPNSPTYYDQLIGQLGGARDIELYVAEGARAQVNRLLQWEFNRGFAQCLLFSAHSSISSLIDIENCDEAVVEKFFSWLEAQGDRFSQVAGLEVGLSVVNRFPSIEPLLIGIATQIRDDDPADVRGRLKLTSNLFIFVDGELARIGIFRNKPPFWRRLAAIAQASIIERKLIGLGIVSADAADWPAQGRGQHFFMQTLADLRLEPRWLPDLMNPDQLRFEFLGRVNMAGERYKEKITSDRLRRIFINDGPEGLRSCIKFPFAYLPGPLEGASESATAVPNGPCGRPSKAGRWRNTKCKLFCGHRQHRFGFSHRAGTR